jgi:hypothetical protein
MSDEDYSNRRAIRLAGLHVFRDALRRSIGEMKHRLFLIVVGGTIVVSMAGWLYTLGWGALKLVQLI